MPLPVKFLLLIVSVIITGLAIISLLQAAHKGRAEFERVYNEYLKNHGQEYFLKYKEVSFKMNVLIWSVIFLVGVMLMEFYLAVQTFNQAITQTDF